MNYQHFYRTIDARMPTVHVLVTSDQHVQDLKQQKHHVCIQYGKLAEADAVYLKTSPMPDRREGQVFYPSEESSQAIKVVGKALVFCFETEIEMHTFCEKCGAIEGTLYQQIPG
jgi:hypothetical protein